MHKNFIISGSGRSGTKFLSSVMNRSEKWTVLHEPPPKKVWNNNKENIPEVQQVFDREYYGEVNSMRRRIFMDLKVEKRGVLIRNPFELWLSISNRKLSVRRRFNCMGGRKKKGEFGVESRTGVAKKWMEELDESLHIIDHAIENGAYPIYFHRMISDTEYMKKILKHFEIDDVKVTPDLIFTRINETPSNRTYQTIDDIPFSVSKVHETCDWFYDKYLKGRM